MPRPLDRRRVPRGRSGFKPDQRTPHSVLPDCNNKQNLLGVLRQLLSHRLRQPVAGTSGALLSLPLDRLA